MCVVLSLQGWVWLGVGWVQEHVWLDAPTSAKQDELLAAMQGVIGVRAFRGNVSTFLVSSHCCFALFLFPAFPIVPYLLHSTGPAGAVGW